MSRADITELHAVVRHLQRQPWFAQTLERLHEELEQVAAEPFVWSVLAAEQIAVALPPEIHSCWIFLLRDGMPSGRHYHPNSIQHMIALNGHGEAHVGDARREMLSIDARGALDDMWFVIERGEPHEFLPRGEHMAVVSFHTCAADELEEIACGSGGSRHYVAAHSASSGAR